MQDLNDKITGGTLTAAEWNEVPSEIQNVIEALGITLSGGDLNQLGKAIAGYVANGTFYTDSGVADAYVLTKIGSKQSLTAYTDGATFEFLAGNVNTGGAATVNVAGLGVKSITLEDGTNPPAGEINGRVTLKFDSGNDRCELVNRTEQLVIFSASGSYSKPAGLKAAFIQQVGAGGGAGGAGSAGSGASAGGGGGGGEYRSGFFAASALSASETVTIGAAGSGGSTSGTNGTAGGNTSFGALLVANGGAGGTGDTTRSTTVGRGEVGGAGGVGGSGGIRTIVGQQGGTGSLFNTTALSGGGGDSGLGIGGGIQINGGAGNVGTGAGSGGSGGAEATATGRVGGAGSAGLIVIRELY